MPEKSAAMLTTFATTSNEQLNNKIRLEPCRRIVAANPSPDVTPSRPHMIWTAHINGKVKKTVQSWVSPNVAPVIE